MIKPGFSSSILAFHPSSLSIKNSSRVSHWKDMKNTYRRHSMHVGGEKVQCTSDKADVRDLHTGNSDLRVDSQTLVAKDSLGTIDCAH
jgi:hypothetical protein